MVFRVLWELQTKSLYMTIFKLPDLGEGLPEAEIHEWHIAEGDEVKLDQPLVSMETAKAVVDIPSPVEGRIVKLYGKPGDVIHTGAPLIEFLSKDTPAKDAGTVVGAIETSDAILVESATGVAVQLKKPTQQIKATPAVRMLATNLGVDLNTVHGTAPNGAITADDVKQAAGKTKQPADKPQGDIVHGARRAMAHNMARAHAQVVPVTLIEDADLHRWPDKTDTTLRLVQAIISACKAEPALNAHFYSGSEEIRRQLWTEINLGIAVDTPGGLYVPVIKDVANQSPESLRTTINTFKEKAKAQSFSPADLSSATVTLSNFGSIVGRYANPIIVPPTVAIIGIGKTRQRVVAWEGKPAIHAVIPISLTFDHRAATGGEAARFMAALVESLEA
jgi:pyruvate dehydrogenase E2 component (dihydrolipoamide acetyltransferase)